MPANGAATATAPRPFRLAKSSQVPEVIPPEVPMVTYQPSRPVRFGLFIGTLMTSPPPKNWTWNPSVITLLILIAGIIGGGAYYMGRQASIIENIQQQAAEAKQKAEAADTKATYAVKDADIKSGHADPPKKKTEVKPKPQTGE